MPNQLENVFVLWHTNPDNNDDAKLIGIYSTQKNAEKAVLSLQRKPGFKEHPQCFETCPYKLDLTLWTEGFITIKPKPAKRPKAKETKRRGRSKARNQSKGSKSIKGV